MQFIVVSLKEGMFNNANVLFRTKFVDGVSTVQRTVTSKQNKWPGLASRIILLSDLLCSLNEVYYITNESWKYSYQTKSICIDWFMFNYLWFYSYSFTYHLISFASVLVWRKTGKGVQGSFRYLQWSTQSRAMQLNMEIGPCINAGDICSSLWFMMFYVSEDWSITRKQLYLVD